MILAASSPFFQKLLGRNKHPHPLIYMRGVKSDDLMAIVDFLYHGEANVYQENLDSFLAIAEELQLKGLMEKTDKRVEDFEEDEKPQMSPAFNENANISKASFKRQIASAKIQSLEENTTIAMPSNFSGDFEELEERVRSFLGKSQNMLSDGRKAYICKSCGKEGHSTTIKDHIEANHLEGTTLPCNRCEKTCRSRNALRNHKRQHHNNS